ncbi:UV DNA damage repair endonuclease UvsE [Salipaludibacillus daqingensis]|uniref:UV DNA damage repair endonuclease UvsE n=1 Tax=Salipaludibacillus daqingensis TaxID=3041001 RepID=UPI00247359A1|nr:UV DNA damage repair endonuclease UvsE [Salipaludibacillus daqingensis]
MSLLLGYACINTVIPTKLKTCRLATYHKKGKEIIKQHTISNLKSVILALKWNIKNDILFFRISSDIVPLGSHQDMDWEWWLDSDVLDLTTEIKTLQENYQMRLSMHPGQYTVISSTREDVFKRSVKDLEYHDRLLNLIGGTEMIIHGGGAYGDMDSAKNRFADRYLTLSSSIRKKLILENDDVTYQLHDVLEIHDKCGIPICFDIHHHHCNHGKETISLRDLFDKVIDSWPSGTTPKVHISSGKEYLTDRRHHDYVFKEDFEKLLAIINGRNVDIMLEAKKKEQAVLKLTEEVSN